MTVDLSMYDVDKVRCAQRAVRHFLSLKRVIELNNAAIMMKNDCKVDIDPTKELLMAKAKNQSLTIQKVPHDVWIEIITFIPSLSMLVTISQVCDLFYEISKINIFWCT